MTSFARKTLSTLKKLFLGVVIIFTAYLLIITVFVVWAFESKLARWPLYIHAAPFELRAGDNLKENNLMERLRRLGYQSTPHTVSQPGHWNQKGGVITLTLKHSALKGQGIVSGPVEIELDWNRVRSIRLMRSKEDVERIYIEPELLAIVPPAGEKAELCRGVPLTEMHPTLIKAVILTEDARFRSHHGIDLISIRHALKANIKAGRYVEGASTITQQLMKMTLLTREKTLIRKINEAFLALVADALYQKETILQGYLNRVYLGHWGSFPVKGVAEASRLFFGKDQRDLDASECALLAAIIKAPNVISPRYNPDRARKRRNVILGLLRKDGAISQEEYEVAKARPVIMVTSGMAPVKASRFVTWVRDRVDREVGNFKPSMGNQDLLTSLDPLIQNEVLQYAGTLSPSGSRAFVILANPGSGAVRAFVAPSPEEWAGTGERLNPLLALMAVPALTPQKLERAEYTLASQFHFPEFHGKACTFRNAFHQQPEYLMRHLRETVGLQRIISTLGEFGVSARADHDGKITIQPVSPTEMASIYALFATLGDSGGIAPAFRIVGKYTVESPAQRKRVQVDPRILFLVNHLMKPLDTVSVTSERGHTDVGTPSSFSIMDDEGLWSVAYRRDRLLLVRMPGNGFSQDSIRQMVRRLVPRTALHATSSAVTPRGVVFRKTCVESGLRATSLCPTVVREAFLKGTQPVEWCPLRHETRALPSKSSP